ncbi:uncharacterized protein LOC110017955 isoform X2 [Phalaenopsis equestris]|uniref:uncharacterized protein LOC110017955 isoform X2 n=1 Tax=Phalaenopsis equestris TaxID=78828 RepID=UPI0009E4E864|nr:uncharacterized protein LOC110017955 isoform X2 [Phalaenopsis equestris]
MEMEGRGFSELVRSTTEEIFMKAMVDNPIGNSVPNMGNLGFNNFMQPFNADSLELFNGWLMNGESPASGITHRTRQASMRISADLGLCQQNAVSFSTKSSHANTSVQNFIDDHSSHPDQYSLRSKFAAMQDSQVKVIPHAPHNVAAHSALRLEHEFTNRSNLFNFPMAGMPNQLQKLMSPSNSSTPFKHSTATGDTISSVLSMLEGNLEPENFGRNVDKETFEGCSYGALTSQEAACSISPVFHIFSPVDRAASRESLELSMKGFPAERNHIQMRNISRETSQSDSSTAAAALSMGFDVCSNSRKHVGYGSLDLETRDKESRERMLETHFKDSTKKESLAWMDSVSSVGKVDSTKRRRVERSRKMAEAKERNSKPSLPSDMEGILKHCENLEQEVRSLKLNLSFMNRKDSEQTKQIEELQKQNDELTKEKERLLEVMELNIH